jgi:hippurate hydrolase
MRAHLLTLSALALSFAVPAQADDLEAVITLDYRANLEDLFTHFHENPELSFLEEKTSARLAQEIEALGYDVTTGVGGTGIVAVLENGPGPTVMIRADMDGLPVKERSGLSYASTVMQENRIGVEQPVMHACGHDVHITSLVGTARQMMNRRADWSGTLVLIGQPAEEIISGARAMMEDGLYTRFPKPDYALAFHVSAQSPTGKIIVPNAAAMSSSDSVDMYVYGVGAHGASPHKGVDPILIASHIVVGLQSAVSRTLSPLDSGVITVGAFNGGLKHNIIPDEVHLQLTVRSDDPDVRTQLLDAIDRIAEGTARAYGVPDDLLPKVVRSPTQTTPPTVNDTETAQRLRQVFIDQIDEDIILDVERKGMGAEDFAYFITPESGVKGVYISVGGTKPSEVQNAPSHHSPFFKVEPKESIILGTQAMVVAALDLFNG